MQSAVKTNEQNETQFAPRPNSLYTIGEAGFALSMWRNRIVFDPDDSGAPKENEIFILLFTDAWRAVRYIDLESRKPLSLYQIASQENWDFYRGLAESGEVHRALINPCSLTSGAHDSFFAILDLEKESDFSRIFREGVLPAPCEVCYDQARFLATQDPDRKITITTRTNER
jgi:hypothetical protein